MSNLETMMTNCPMGVSGVALVRGHPSGLGSVHQNVKRSESVHKDESVCKNNLQCALVHARSRMRTGGQGGGGDVDVPASKYCS